MRTSMLLPMAALTLALAGCGSCRYASDVWYGRCSLTALSDEDVRVLAPWVPLASVPVPGL